MKRLPNCSNLSTNSTNIAVEKSHERTNSPSKSIGIDLGRGDVTCMLVRRPGHPNCLGGNKTCAANANVCQVLALANRLSETTIASVLRRDNRFGDFTAWPAQRCDDRRKQSAS